MKLEQVLPAHLRRRVAALGVGDGRARRSAARRSIRSTSRRSPPPAATPSACGFAYRSRDGAETRRDVEPHALVNLGRRWYLVAWDRAPRGLAHVPRRPRSAGPPPTGVRFAPRTLPAADAAAYVEQSIARRAGSRYEARVTVHAPAERGRGAPAVGGERARADRRERCEYRTSDDDLEWLALRIVMLDEDVDVHEPPELVAMLRGLARRLQRATGGEG